MIRLSTTALFFSLILGATPSRSETVVSFDLDYAQSTDGSFSPCKTIGGSSPSLVCSDTFVTVGLPAKSPTPSNACQVQVAWFNADGSSAGVSGPGPFLALGQTQFFSTVSSQLQTMVALSPGLYNPETIKIFRSVPQSASYSSFSGHGEVYVTCTVGTPPPKLRINAEITSVTGNQNGSYFYQVGPATSLTVNISKPAGISGY
jgi:hypothetical protein